ncbi:Protein of uncharacterised function (DUF1161) [Klebsiella pneumoniae]|uniref:Protein of uncharacterized function (DUF1161) n=1 Tax=Klebsiella pneumoniae TaxID=573 RepID=A0A2X1QJ37_KLEPN|nr:Protein of uncharacterised function (DUF1161) [Klebsiella pneumoniae]
MKLSLCTGAALLLCSTAVLAAPDSCERVKSDIQQKIINNGVPETAFSLAIVPNDQADQPGFRWSVIAPTTPSKSPIRVTATVPPKTTLSKPSSVSNERSYPCIDQG